VREYRRYATNSALVVLYSLFVWANFTSTRHTGSPTGIGLMVLEGWVAALFLFRREAFTVSGSAVAWVAAPIGSFAMILGRPAGNAGLSHAVAESIQLAGVAVAIISLAALGRSFGIVAANRGIRTSGPYRFVRHPVYAGYLIAWAGYVAESPSVRNFSLLALGVLAQGLRMHEEERVLSNDDEYRRYKGVVRHRLIPYVY
jgi:protein-S-isoprenylcysteine O-methyltransferase Ste14